jgi:hypothetical protein
MFGLTLKESWGAMLLILYAYHYDIGVVETTYPFAFIGGVFSAAGVLCKLRVLSPAWGARWLWWVTMLTAFASGLAAIGVSEIR